MKVKISKAVIVLLLITLIKGLIWVFITPVFQTPDEPQHYSYVQYLAEKQSIPQITKLEFEASERLAKQMAILEVEQIAHNSHIQHSFYRSASSVHPHDALNAKDIIALDATPSELNYIHNYGPLYYALNLPIYLAFEPNLAGQIHAMRIFSVLLSCLTVFLVYLTSRRIFKKYLSNFTLSKSFPFATALLFTLHPQFSFISASVNNDNLIILLFSFFFYLIVRWMGETLSLKKILLLLLLGFAGFITKTQGIILMILILLYLFLDLLQRVNWKKMLLFTSATIVSAIASASIFFDQILKGFVQNESAITSYFSEYSILWFLKTITFTRLFRTYKSFWGRYGWLDTLMPEWAYYMLFGLMLAGFVGLIVFVVRNLRKIKEHKNFLRLLGFFALSILLVDFIYTVLFAKNAVLFEYYNFPIQGRYYFIVLMPIIFLLMLGIAGLVREKWQNRAMAGAVYLVFFVHVISLFALVPIRYYL